MISATLILQRPAPSTLVRTAGRLAARPLCLVLAFLGTASAADETAPSAVPFVAGFDRFGRHADIDSETAGRLLITELSCTACHASSDDRLVPKRGPVLNGAGSRLRADWINAFLLSPSNTRHGAIMPDLLASLPIHERQPAANALTAFLSSLQQDFPDIKASGLTPVPMEFWNRGNADRGRQLYHQIGCVACHAPDESYEVTTVKSSPLDELLDQLEPDELKEMGLSSAARRVNSVPHPQLASKYTHRSLTFFLLDPDQTRPSGRMPGFSLLPVDAADIAAWLLRNANQLPLQQTQKPAEDATRTDAALVAKGRQLFTELRCATCHQVSGITSDSSAKPLADLGLTSSRACVMTAVNSNRDAAAKREKGQPTLMLDQAQHAAIASAIASMQNPPTTNDKADDKASKEADKLTFRLLQHNCFACHERDTLGGVDRFRKPYFDTVGHVDIGDEGRLPPALTGVGRRLKDTWLNSVLAGKGSVRPHMTIRMPVFPDSFVKPLPVLFTAVDGNDRKPLSETDVFAPSDTKTLLEAGRQLMDTGCVQCHPFRGETIPGTVGVDLEGVAGRLQPEWLHDFLKDPGSLKPRTRMPTFFPGGKSQNPDVLNGDTELQIAAMFAYMKHLSSQQLPEKIRQARAQSYELTPVDRPIILRTFMRVAGTHAIAVGYPQHVHFAFDAEHISLAQAWRGRFLDAEGTWFVRLAPPADPLGELQVNLPPGIAIAMLEGQSAPWPDDASFAGARFSGYRLDKAGVPTFLYVVDGHSITDRIEPDEDNGLSRTITIDARTDPDKEFNPDASRQLWFRAHAGSDLKQKSPQAVVSQTGLVVIVRQSVSKGEIRTIGDSSEWIFPVPIKTASDSRTTFEVQYQW